MIAIKNVQFPSSVKMEWNQRTIQNALKENRCVEIGLKVKVESRSLLVNKNGQQGKAESLYQHLSVLFSIPRKERLVYEIFLNT